MVLLFPMKGDYMDKQKVQSLIKSLDILGLTDKDLDELAHWYSYFTNRREDGHQTGFGYMLGSPIIDKKAQKKGTMLFGNVLNELDDFESPLIVESLDFEGIDLCLKCSNKSGEKLVIAFQHGDLIDLPTCISLIGHSNVKIAKIMLDKKAGIHKLSYSDAETQGLSEHFKEIYHSAYGNKTF